jgi:hypothetical protein
MSIKSKVFAAAGVLTLVAGVSAMGELSASATTPQCGVHCVEVYSAEFGTAASPDFVETVYEGVAKVGQPTVLDRPGGASDLKGHAGLVSSLYQHGLVSAEVNKHYGNLHAAQIEYAPYGVPSHLCVGLATAAYQTEDLTLQPCDTPGTTVWIIDTADSPATAPGLFPLVNGSTTDFTHPFAMTYDGRPNGDRQGEPKAIRVKHLDGNPTRVPDNQLWGLHFGVLQ